MRSTTSATDPVSYYEVLATFWAAACTARGTDLRGQSLVNLDVLGPMLKSFVMELGSKLRPAGIEYGLGQAGSGESTGIDVPDADAPVLAHEPGVQAEELAAAESELDQIEAGRPALIVPAGSFLNLPTVVPYPIHRPSLLFEVPAAGRILDPVPVGQHHGNMVVDTACENKTDAKHLLGIFTLDLPSVRDAETLSITSNSIVIGGAPPPRRERQGFRRGELG